MLSLKKLALISSCLGGLVFAATPVRALDYEDYPIVKLRTLDKITARTMTFEAKVGTTMKFGEIYIKVQTCRKPPPVQKTEAAAFLQIWQTDAIKNTSNWIFSGWMFASSPALSAMNHPVYDVWVIDCLGKDPEELPPPEATTEGDGIVSPGSAESAPPPAETMPEAIGPATQTPEATPGSETDSGPVTREDDPGAFEDEPAPATEQNPAEETEPVPASNLPADAEALPETETVPQEPEQGQPPQPVQPAVPPVEAAPEGIY